MKARLRKDKDIYFFDLEGNLDISGVDYLQSFCFNKNLKKKKIVFNLSSLFFVGSRGVGVFSKTLDFVKQNNYLKICCASPEFKKIFTNEGLDSFMFFPSEKEAVLSFSDKGEKTEEEFPSPSPLSYSK